MLNYDCDKQSEGERSSRLWDPHRGRSYQKGQGGFLEDMTFKLRSEGWVELQDVAGRIMAPKDVHVLIPRICEYVPLHSKRDVIHLRVVFFSFFWPYCAACRILVPWPGIEPGPWQWKPQVLTTGPPGNSLQLRILRWEILLDYRCGPIVITGVLMRRRQRVRGDMTVKEEEDGTRYLKNISKRLEPRKRGREQKFGEV